MVFTLKWGIMATGGIAQKFVSDLLQDPELRGTTDVAHEVVAVASSTSKDRAAAFASQFGLSNAATYGNLEEFVKDQNIDIVYVASPHSHHYRHALLALRAGKNVLCEKAFTVNAKQVEHLIETARQNKVYLMEAVWTRFFPIVKILQQQLFDERVIGAVKRVKTDLSIDFSGEADTHRMRDPKLAGGALLDLGPYMLVWQFLCGYQDPANKGQAPRVAGAHMTFTNLHVDETSSVLLDFPGSGAQGLGTCSQAVFSANDSAAIIEGETGYVVLDNPPYAPQGFSVWTRGPDNKFALKERVRELIPEGAVGLFWEADECARNIRAGRLESPTYPLAESLAVQRVFDEMRRLNNFVFSDELEGLDQ